MSFLDESSVVVRLRTCCTALDAEAFGSVTRTWRTLDSWVGIRSGSYVFFIIWHLKVKLEFLDNEDSLKTAEAIIYIRPAQPYDTT